jgi:Gram-negative bacterial TonB protein C-terminal
MSSWVGVVMALAAIATDGGLEPALPFDGAVLTRPVPLTPIDWSYPDEARTNNPGDDHPQVRRDRAGRVQDCEVLRSLPGVTEWAIAKLRAARFKPATLEGRAVRIQYVFNIRITPGGEKKPPIEVPRWRPPPSPEVARTCKGPNAAMCR